GSPVAASGWGDPLPNPRHSSIALMAFSAQIGPPDRFVGCAAASKPHKGGGRSSALLCRRDVLVAPEEVPGIVFGLDGAQPLPGFARIGGADALGAIDAEEVHIG